MFVFLWPSPLQTVASDPRPLIDWSVPPAKAGSLSFYQQSYLGACRRLHCLNGRVKRHCVGSGITIRTRVTYQRLRVTAARNHVLLSVSSIQTSMKLAVATSP